MLCMSDFVLFKSVCTCMLEVEGVCACMNLCMFEVVCVSV